MKLTKLVVLLSWLLAVDVSTSKEMVHKLSCKGSVTTNCEGTSCGVFCTEGTQVSFQTGMNLLRP